MNTNHVDLAINKGERNGRYYNGRSINAQQFFYKKNLLTVYLKTGLFFFCQIL